jgi:hypothetical protein
MLHRMSGFKSVQQVKGAAVLGVGFQVPFTARPRTGPMSRRYEPPATC